MDELGSSTAVSVRDLVKRYPKLAGQRRRRRQLRRRPGEVFGLLGPNGAGKTTTVGVLTTRVRPTSGSASVAGVDVVRDPVRARSALAVVPQRSNLDRALSIRAQPRSSTPPTTACPPRERSRARRRAARAVRAARARRTQKPDMFSGGQAQRVMIARALMHAPQVLFLDEPSTGLDPAARLFVWDRLRELRDRGVTLFLTTHDMDEAAALADRVGIMDHGTLLALDTPEALMRSVPGGTTLELDDAGRATPRPASGSWRRSGRCPASSAPRSSARARTATRTVAAAGTASCACASTSPATRRCSSRRPPRCSADHGSSLTDVKLGTPTLEDVFIDLTGTDAPVSALAAASARARPAARVPRRAPARRLRHLGRVPGLPRPGDPAAVLPAVRVRQGARQPRLHAPRLLRPALPRAARADRGDHGHADARVPARDRVRLDEGDRGPAARADVDRSSSPPRRCCSPPSAR